jgi:hypothetical protein
MTLPAPWQDDPNERVMLSAVPTKTHEAVPIEPGMITGCPIF